MTSSPARTRSRQQAGLTGLYLGVFAAIWFSVPSAGGALRALLVAGAWAGLLTAACGLAVLIRARRDGQLGRDRRYLLIVAAEFAAAGFGALLLSLAGWIEYIPALVAAVVGAHFFPLVRILNDPLLRVLGAVVCVVAAAALITGLATAVPAGRVAGTGTGLALLAYAATALLRRS